MVTYRQLIHDLQKLEKRVNFLTFLHHGANPHLIQGGGVYVEDSFLVSDRTIDLNGKFLSVEAGGNQMLFLSPVANNETATLRAYNITLGGNESYTSNTTNASSASIALYGAVNGGIKEISILGSVTSLGSSFSYSADSHTFSSTGDSPTLFLVQGSTPGFEFFRAEKVLNAEVAQVNAYNITGGGNFAGLNAQTSDILASTQIGAGFNAVAKFGYILIQSNATEAKITQSANRHIIMGLQAFANNAAALVGGLAAGDQYYTNVAGDGVLKIVL